MASILATIVAQSTELSMTPVMIIPQGTKIADKLQSVLSQSTGLAAVALMGEKGSLGKAARAQLSGNPEEQAAAFAMQCSHQNYREFAIYIAAKAKCAVLCRNRAEYQSLPYILNAKLAEADAKGTKTGEREATNLRSVLNDVVEIQRKAESLYQERQVRVEETAPVETIEG
jgi:hypothetical protein